MSTSSAYLKRLSHFYGSKEGNDTGILMDRQTVVEKKDFVSTGVLTYVLGDIIEVEISQFNVFELGDKVKLTVYTASGMFVFETTVVAKDSGSLIVINPPENRRKFTEKREFPRIDVQKQGVLFGFYEPVIKKKDTFEKPIQFAVDNISMSGLGFIIDFDMGIKPNNHLQVELDLGFQLDCDTEIVRKQKSATGIYYGAQFINMPLEKMNALRAFVLKSQVETYFVKKREEMHERALQEKKSVANG
jgi:hypothetical protein